MKIKNINKNLLFSSFVVIAISSLLFISGIQVNACSIYSSNDQCVNMGSTYAARDPNETCNTQCQDLSHGLSNLCPPHDSHGRKTPGYEGYNQCEATRCNCDSRVVKIKNVYCCTGGTITTTTTTTTRPNDPVSGTLSVDKTTVAPGESFTLTAVGEDNNGVSSVSIYRPTDDHWVTHRCGGGKKCTNRLVDSESEPGTYTFWGYVYGHKPGSIDEGTYTSPRSVSVMVVANDPPTVSLDLPTQPVQTGESFTARVTGEDDIGVKKVEIIGQTSPGNWGGSTGWLSQDCDVTPPLLTCTKSWNFTRDQVGQYMFCPGSVDTSNQYSTTSVANCKTITVIEGNVPSELAVSLTANGNTSITVNTGDEVTLKATPSGGETPYQHYKWTIEDSDISGGQCHLNDPSNISKWAKCKIPGMGYLNNSLLFSFLHRLNDNLINRAIASVGSNNVIYYQWGSPGTYKAQVKVVDKNNKTALSNFVTIVVVQAPPPTCDVTLNSDASARFLGYPFTLSWDLSNDCTSCQANCTYTDSGDNACDVCAGEGKTWCGPITGSNDEELKPTHSGKYTYTISCDNGLAASTDVKVSPLPWWREIIPQLPGFLRGLFSR